MALVARSISALSSAQLSWGFGSSSDEHEAKTIKATSKRVFIGFYTDWYPKVSQFFKEYFKNFFKQSFRKYIFVYK